MRQIRAGSSLSAVAADFLAEALDSRLRDQPRASLALSGGSTPWAAFSRLSKADIDWSRVDVYQVDERIAPAGDAARNLTGLADALLDHVPTCARPMPVNDSDLDAAAIRYADALPESLDVVHLGLGGDGHTASLVPGDPVLRVADRRVAVTQPYEGHRRMTLTFPALNAAGSIIWIVSAKGKASALRKLRNADPTIPAGRVAQVRAVLLTDEVGDS
jgi:6-phosphogluconolactonase